MSDIVTGKDGTCFYCDKPVSSIRFVPGRYDNGEPTMVIIGICKDCEANK